MNIKTRKSIFWIFIIGVGIGITFLLIKTIIGISKLNRDFTELLDSTYYLTSDDSSIICSKYWGKLKVNEISRSKVRTPVSFIFFDKDYNLVIYKFNLLDSISLKNLIHLERKSAHVPTGYSYRVVDNGIPFEFQYKAGKTYPISKIILTLAGDSLSQIVNTDSIVGYHLNCKNFSIKYSNEEPIDLHFGRALFSQQIPLNLLFLKEINLSFFY